VLDSTFFHVKDVRMQKGRHLGDAKRIAHWVTCTDEGSMM
jgi:hypothetical protein